MIERLVDKAARETRRGARRDRGASEPHPARSSCPYKTPMGQSYDSGDFAAMMAARHEGRRLGRLRRAQGGERRSAASCAASASPTTSRSAAARRTSGAGALRCRRRRHRADRQPVERPGPRDRLSRRSSPRSSASPSRACASCRATPISADIRRRHRRQPRRHRRRRQRDLGRADDRSSSKGRKLAAQLLEAAESDIEFKDGQLHHRRHRPRRSSFVDVAQAARDIEQAAGRRVARPRRDRRT